MFIFYLEILQSRVDNNIFCAKLIFFVALSMFFFKADYYQLKCRKKDQFKIIVMVFFNTVNRKKLIILPVKSKKMYEQ